MMGKHNGVRPNFQMNVTGVYGKAKMLNKYPRLLGFDVPKIDEY